MITVAALYVETDGPYFGLPGVDPWDAIRDARSYNGRHPVVAHPPCERWGRYWGGGPMLHGTPKQKKLGDDGGCFSHAVNIVSFRGGVLEHPEASHGFAYAGLVKPPKSGGWVPSGNGYGWVCCVEQGHYGHPARKATWLYYVGKREPPVLIWGASTTRQRLEPGFHSKAERASAPASRKLIRRLTKREMVWTPEPFRDLLIGLARRSV